MSLAENIKVGADGRLVLPLEARQAMGISGEAHVIVTIEGDEVRLSPVDHGLKRAQQVYREHAKGDFSVDDFLRERKDEARRDDEKYRLP